jgi:predicted transposase YdaD
MSEHIAVEDYEKLSLYERILEEGRIEGREAGRIEGREAGRIEGREAGRIEGKLEVLRSALRPHLELAAFDKLMAIEDPRERIAAMEARFHDLLATRAE